MLANMNPAAFPLAGSATGERKTNLFAFPGGGEEALVVLPRVLPFSFLAFAVTFASTFARFVCRLR